MAAAESSLDAPLIHWQDGREITAADWIAELYEEVWPIAKARGFSCFLSPLKKILRQGNTAQRWLKQYEAGQDIPTIMQGAIAQSTQEEIALENKLCEPLLAA